MAFRDGIESRQGPQVTIQSSPLAADYYDEMDYTKREAINTALRELEAEGVVSLAWPKHREQIEIYRVYLELESLDRAYQLADITPRLAKLATLRDIISPLLHHPWPWVAEWSHGVEHGLNCRKSVGLDLDTPVLYHQLVKVLLALPSLTESTPRRVFSQRVLGDSKEFEQSVERALLRLLREHCSQEFESDEEYLDSVNLVIHPKLTLVAGELEFALGGAVINLSRFPEGLGLSNASLKSLSITSLSTAPILTIENLTTYYQVIQQQSSPWGLVIYIGGFPHSGTQSLLSKLGTFLQNKTPAIDTYHWGDIDYGGIRIFQYLKEGFFPSLKPYLMDIDTYRSHVERGLEFRQGYAQKLLGLLQDARYQEWHPLLEEMLVKKMRVEQESVSSQTTTEHARTSSGC